MGAREHGGLIGWCRLLFTDILFPGKADADTRVRRLSLLLVLLLPAVLLYPTRGFHLLEPDEGRYAQIPKEMLVNGSWVVPTLQGEPYLDKPPLMYWLTALSYRAFGISQESARLVPALCVHFTILAIYLIGRRSVGERSAFWAAMLLSVAPGFVSVARLLLLDGLLVLCVTTSVLCGFEAVRTGKLKRGWWIAAAVASGLGFLTKGPISEVLLFVPLWVYGFLMRGGERQPNPLTPFPKKEGGTEPNTTNAMQPGMVLSPSPFRGGVGEGLQTQPAPAVVRWYWYLTFFGVVFAVNLPWYVAIYFREPQFLKYFFWEHNVMRFLQPFDHLQPIWYYVPILLGGLLPGTLLFAAYFWRLLRPAPGDSANRSSAGGFWLLTGAWCAFFFSCSGSKLPTYVLPAYPFLCLAIGEFVARTKWNTAFRTRALIGGMAALVMVAHYVAVPWYARERSPFGRPELVERFVSDHDVAVVCFPRNCDSLAFYHDRSDMRNVRTKSVNQLMVDCHHRPRTVILFTHHDSLQGFKNTLPPSLEIVETSTLKRKGKSSLLDKFAGATPWGLCDVAVVVPKYHVPPRDGAE
ncbi:Undecaprenyl phosphate-alpha-4-amino-4-deoxy-L-arabinose arabinosyl transferase [Gemmata sp. SH-PL17]|uniref:ArnT family glycosyltransferase n=1 Tax=Gemmata sp. SH-PL17 TaxID=1630693 RepID=UPI00078C9A2C|nr:glycosyltransferase family 39 protein [Gemmata sp. SH-PL17]AMV28024.1 Undecaprenyl phosphate-alpha-4-amino-4-deoxy-L-arabinose arabinosyl transferase [Gemmata sp. SH-PL17]